MKNSTKRIKCFVYFVVLFYFYIPVFANETYEISAQTDEYKTEEYFRSKLDDFNNVNFAYHITPQGLTLSIDSSVFFEKNSDIIRDNSKLLLNKIGETIKFLDKPCQIECSEKNPPPCKSIYSYSWEISLVRAQKISQYLINNFQIPPNKIRSIGYGEIVPFNFSETNLENRIDFVIENFKQ